MVVCSEYVEVVVVCSECVEVVVVGEGRFGAEETTGSLMELELDLKGTGMLCVDIRWCLPSTHTLLPTRPPSPFGEPPPLSMYGVPGSSTWLIEATVICSRMDMWLNLGQ